MNLHPKIRAASIAALVVAVLNIVVVVAGNYPDSTWGQLALTLCSVVTPLVAGWAKSSGGAA